ncbi:MAG: winged helix DNA-binding domain-containing protein [Nitrososphaerales archaeon]|jgi:hypothetical protein
MVGHRSAIAGLRLLNQGLARPSSLSASEVVKRLTAVQAQDYAGSLWSVGMRMREGEAEEGGGGDATQDGVERAIADRAVVRTWPMRGTLHLVAAEDVRWLLRLLAPRVAARNAGRLVRLGLDAEVIARSRKTLADALRGGVCLTRGEVYGELQRKGALVHTSGQRGLMVLWLLAHEGLVCLGPRRGKQPTFVLLDDWIAPSRDRTPEDPLRELAERYFASRGPATVKDLAWWSGLNLSEAKEAVRAAGADLEEVDLSGSRYWMAAHGGSRGAAPSSPNDALLLSAFDEYTIAYRDRGAVIEARFAGRTAGPIPILFCPKIVLGGEVAGTWKRELRRDEVRVGLAPFEAMDGGQREAVAREVERYGRFLGTRAVASYD